MSAPTLTLTDDDSNVYNFPASFWLTDEPWEKSSSIENLAYADGGRNVGDDFLTARSITIEGFLYANTLAQMETAENALINAVKSGGQLTVSDDTVSRYIDVRYATSNQSYQGDWRNQKPFSFTFIAENPYWQAAAETSDVNVLAGNDTFATDNSSSNGIVLPIIEIAADQAANLPDVKIVNQSDSNMTFQYVDSGFTVGDTLVIDSALGTVELNGNDVMANATGLRFLRLQPQNNTFIYTGNACTITVKFRVAYLR